jgi:2-hydroxy-3-keto-5-methylthiopentenyl-1-phosphate phosphatase
MVFTDFDGTITDTETLMGLMMELVPQKAQTIGEKLFKGEVTLRKGVRELIESIESKQYGFIVEYSRTCRIRQGFGELLDYLDSLGVPLVVISGGLKVMVETVLGPLVSRCKDIWAVDIAADGPFLKAVSPLQSQTELVDKRRILSGYYCKEPVVIGDGITDIEMSKAASLVFARKRLGRHLDRENISYLLWKDFSDVQKALEERWGRGRT